MAYKLFIIYNSYFTRVYAGYTDSANGVLKLTYHWRAECKIEMTSNFQSCVVKSRRARHQPPPLALRVWRAFAPAFMDIPGLEE